jgi:hypothetical protein
MNAVPIDVGARRISSGKRGQNGGVAQIAIHLVQAAKPSRKPAPALRPGHMVRPVLPVTLRPIGGLLMVSRLRHTAF